MRALIYTIPAMLCMAGDPALSDDTANLPPYTQGYEPRDVDERGLWMLTDEYERKLQESPLVVQDEKLNAYVKGVLCNTVGTDRCNGVRVYIVETAQFNATMMPNGSMQVYSGLLLRVRNEAELGAILGHEFGHFELRHSLAGFKQHRGASDVAAWIAVLGGITNTNTNGAQFSIASSIFSYKRDQEEAADLLGLTYLGLSQYPSSAAASVWGNLMSEEDATYAGRKRKKEHNYSSGFFDTHPTNLKRAIYLTEKAIEVGDDGDVQTERYYAAIKDHLPRWLDAQNKLNDFGGTDYLLTSIADINGWTADLLFARGQMYQTRGNPRDLVSAAQFYREAIAAGYKEPEVHRNLGLALLRNGENSEAGVELGNYLKLRPDAQDYSVISALAPPSANAALLNSPEMEGAQ